MSGKQIITVWNGGKKIFRQEWKMDKEMSYLTQLKRGGLLMEHEAQRGRAPAHAGTRKLALKSYSPKV